eukprot:1156585-Pelagomonas_calceolata.AAC.11
MAAAASCYQGERGRGRTGSTQHQPQPLHLPPRLVTLVSSLRNRGMCILWRSNIVKTPSPRISSRAKQQHRNLCHHLFEASAQVTLHTILLGVGGVIYTPQTLEPFTKELGLNTLKATKLALKLHAHSVLYAYKLASARRALEKTSTTLVSKIRHGILLMLLLISNDIFLFLVERIHGVLAPGVNSSLIDVGVFSLPMQACLCHEHLPAVPEPATVPSSCAAATVPTSAAVFGLVAVQPSAPAGSTGVDLTGSVQGKESEYGEGRRVKQGKKCKQLKEIEQRERASDVISHFPLLNSFQIVHSLFPCSVSGGIEI